MQNQLKIACIQSDIVWENPKVNIENYSSLIDTLPKDIDLVILPEMFSTGFSMNPSQCFETMDGASVTWMKQLASEKNIAIMGSLVIKEESRFYNRFIFVHPDGKLEFYDKRHLFTLVGENKIYTAGSRKTIINYLGWKICLMICYDLRFPVWSRNDIEYDLLVYVANWPEKRISAWDTLLKARAIENMCYTIGVNRVGVDANKYNYVGHTQVIDSLGNIIANSDLDNETIVETTLDKSALNTIRDKFLFLKDKDSFFIEK